MKYIPSTHCWCGAPAAKQLIPGRGRPPSRCERHLGTTAPQRRKSPSTCWCGDPITQRRARGRPATRCERHMPPSRAKGAVPA